MVEVEQLCSEVASLQDMLASVQLASLHQCSSRQHSSSWPSSQFSSPKPSTSSEQSDGLCWNHCKFREQAHKCTSPAPSWEMPRPGVDGDQHPRHTPSHLFFVTDFHSGLRFLVDTGAEVCVLPVSQSISSPSLYRSLSSSSQQLQHRDIWCWVPHPQPDVHLSVGLPLQMDTKKAPGDSSWR